MAINRDSPIDQDPLSENIQTFAGNFNIPRINYKFSGVASMKNRQIQILYLIL